MLNALRRLLASGPKAADPGELQRWAENRNYSFRRVRHVAGCVVEGQLGTSPWRIEWGAPQRDFIPGFELRMIAELGLPKELVILVLNRTLMERMERAVYEQYIDDVQTRVDTEAPPESRWLVLYPKIGQHDLGRLRERYAAVASVPPWAQQWLDTPLTDALANMEPATDADDPVVLSLHRGRLTLRASMPRPESKSLAGWFSVFEHGLREARRLGEAWREASIGGQSTLPAAWDNGPVEPGKAGSKRSP